MSYEDESAVILLHDEKGYPVYEENLQGIYSNKMGSKLCVMATIQN